MESQSCDLQSLAYALKLLRKLVLVVYDDSIPGLRWGHCCADFLAVLTRGKNDLAFFCVFHFTRQHFKKPHTSLICSQTTGNQLRWFEHKLFWFVVLFSTSVLSGSSKLLLCQPTHHPLYIFAFVTFSALLFAFIYGFCLTLSKQKYMYI